MTENYLGDGRYISYEVPKGESVKIGMPVVVRDKAFIALQSVYKKDKYRIISLATTGRYRLPKLRGHEIRQGASVCWRNRSTYFEKDVVMELGGMQYTEGLAKLGFVAETAARNDTNVDVILTY